MDNKIAIGIVAVVIVVVAAAVALSYSGGGGNEESEPATVIIYDGNGGTLDGASTSESTVNTVTSHAFTNGDLHLIEWNTSKDGSGTSYRIGATVEGATASSPVTLYAQWGYILHNDSYFTLPSVLSDISIFVLDGETPVLYVEPSKIYTIVMPENGSFVVLQNDGRWTWTLDDSGKYFLGADAEGNHVHLRISLYEEVVQAEYSIVDNVPTLKFSGSGDIRFAISAGQYYPH